MKSDQLTDDLRGVYRRAADRVPMSTPQWSSQEFATRPQPGIHRHRQLLSVATATLLILAVTGIALIARNRSHTQVGAQITAVDLGPVKRFPVGSITKLDDPRVFVVNDPADGVIVLDVRSPHLGCRIVQRASVGDPSVFTGGPDVAFVDPCHGSLFDRVGNKIAGPAARGMYRYRIDTSGGRVLVDTSLLIPGSWGPGFLGGIMPRPQSGIVDDTAKRWRQVWNKLTKRFPAETLVDLGTFHDPTTGISRVEFTYNSVDGELLVFDPSKYSPAPIEPAQIRRVVKSSQGDITIFGPPNDLNTVAGRLIRTDGITLQVAVVAPINDSHDVSTIDNAPTLSAVADLLSAASTSLG